MAKPKQTLTLFIILLVLTILSYEQILQNKYYPFTFAGDTNISFLTEGQATRKLQTKFEGRTKQKLQFIFAQGGFTIDLATSSASLNYNELTFEFNRSHAGNLLDILGRQILSLFFTSKIYPPIKLNLDRQMMAIKSQVDQPAQNAEIMFDETTSPEGTPSARIQIKEGHAGLSLDKERLQQEVIQFILNDKYTNQLPLKSTPPRITTAHVQKAKQALEQILTEPIKLTFQERSWILDAKQLLALLDLTQGLDILDKDRTYVYLEKIASEIDREVQEGL